MNIAVAKVNLCLAENETLKGKRQVLKSIIARVQNTFNVSIAEVDNQDLWQRATLGIACVSNHGQHANEVMSKVIDFISRSRMEAEMLDYELEIIDV